MLVSFLLFLNHLVFVTTYMQVCSTIKWQIDGSLVKVYFSESVGSKCWMLTFTLIFFGLLPKRLCWGPCWWWFTRNIWPKARVACIFCYVWTHLCQTLQYQKMTWEVCCSSNKVCFIIFNVCSQIIIKLLISHPITNILPNK